MSLAGARVLVTGAYGFIGAGLVRGLRDAGAKAVAVGRDARRLEALGVPCVRADVSRPFPVPGRLDYIVHAASPAAPKAYVGDPLGAIAPNVEGTRLLLELARRKRVKRFLYLSSCEVYQQADPMTPRACYSEGKRMGEALCAAFHTQHGVPAVAARLYHTYGPGMDLKDGRVFADFVADAVAGRPIVIRSDGLDRRPFCHLDDAVAALLLLLEKGEPGTAYDLANDAAELSVKELAELVRGLFPDRVPSVTAGRPPKGYVPSPQRRYAFDTARLRALGWAPKVTPAEGFRRTVESYL